MSDEGPEKRLSVAWSPEARADLRRIDRAVALRVLYCIDHYLLHRIGDVKKLKPPLIGFRLRCGDQRVFFEFVGKNSIEIGGVYDCKDAYR